MIRDKEYISSGELWSSNGKGAWHFISIAQNISDEIKFFTKDFKKGWGSVRVIVKIGETEWNTSLFPDSKLGLYVLPVKSDVRKKEKIDIGDVVSLSIKLSI